MIYQELDDLIEAARAGNPQISCFDTSCFNGEYVTGDVSESYLANLSLLRSASARQARSMSSEESLIDLANDAS